jgi:hypothetical protein
MPADWELGMYPGFDTVELKRRIQAEIYEETKGMTNEQIRERRRQIVERDIRWRAEYAAKSESFGTDK